MHRIILTLLMLYSSVNLLAQQAERLTLLFVGDLMQHRAQLDAARTADGRYNYTSCFSLLQPVISQADIAIGNLEVPLGGAPYSGYPAFSAPDAYLEALREAGFDLLLTANNHCLDRQGRGLARTIHQLDSLQMAHTGSFLSAAHRRQHYPLLYCCKGFRLVFLNYTYGTNGIQAAPPYVVNYIDKQQMAADIAQARAMQPDAIIACMHWGEEYRSLPNSEQRQLADWLLAQGVTHVIGSHPHVIQPVERRKAGSKVHVVAYSLGNFISNMSEPHTDGGMLLHMELIKPAPPQVVHPFSTPADSLRFTPLKPYCTLGICNYELVWTARPQVSGLKNFLLCPAQGPLPFASPRAEALRSTFLKNERNLLKQYNIGVNEHPYAEEEKPDSERNN